MHKLFILSGASGAGKSTLLDRIVKDGYCTAVVKYSERSRFNTIDDITTVKKIDDTKLQCDIMYSMYGINYGFSSKSIYTQLQIENLILITNDKSAMNKLKSLFPKQVVTIYIISDINKELLRHIYMKRHGFPSIESIRDMLLEQLKKANKMAIKDNIEGFINCLEKINDIIDELVLHDNEFRLRLDSIKNQEIVYSSDLFTYDYTVLNLYSNNMPTIHATKSAFEQIKRIINKETENINE